MYNTKGDVALTNIRRETIISTILCNIQNKSSSTFFFLSSHSKKKSASRSFKKKDYYIIAWVKTSARNN